MYKLNFTKNRHIWRILTHVTYFQSRLLKLIIGQSRRLGPGRRVLEYLPVSTWACAPLNMRPCPPKAARTWFKGPGGIATFKISQEPGRDLRKVYTLRVLCWVPFYNTVMPLSQLQKHFQYFPKPAPPDKNIKISLTIQIFPTLTTQKGPTFA